MNILLSHPTGNQNVRMAADGLRAQGALAAYRTGIAVFPGQGLDRLAGWSPLREVRRRRLDAGLRPVTRAFPWLEAGRLLAGRLGLTSLTRHETGLLSVDAIYRAHDRWVASQLTSAAGGRLTGVYAYEDGALSTLRGARERGLTAFYDLPIGYWRAARRLLSEERERLPEWATTLKGFKDSAEKLQRKDDEIAAADRILVASSFTARTLEDYPGALPPVDVVPYGFPTPGPDRTYWQGRGPLKLLFVGGLSQRKGVADMFAAVERLGAHVSLTVVGRKAVEDCGPLNEALHRHTWHPSLPHEEVLKLMRAHDVLLFPSLFEGFGLVITEAMSQGTPVITTDRTAGPDLIEHGRNGWLIEAGSRSALTEAIERLLTSPEPIRANGLAARESARRRPWGVYGAELAAVLLQHRSSISAT
ncbi:MAG: glycosyltransferase family 4 protein [Catalinimonas sp.]